MRKCVRPDEPEVLTANSSKWNELWISLKQSNPSASFTWYRIGNVPANRLIREDLAVMTQSHCTFCDVNRLEPETVEHFRPKSDSRFHHLAFTWNNLFLCCNGCQLNKREQWDERLLRPDAEDYSFARYFQFDYTTGGISPNEVATLEDQERASVTIRIYGLDTPARRRFRREELRKWDATMDSSLVLDEFAYRDYLELEPSS